MNYSSLKLQLYADEGIRKTRYKDTVGKWTIGVGHNISDDPDYPFTLKDEPLSAEQIDMLLNKDIAKVVSDLDEYANWWRAMDGQRQLVLANMCFNLGWGRLSKFVNTLAYMEKGDYKNAAEGMRDSLWASQVGARAIRLAQMMEDGK